MPHPKGIGYEQEPRNDKDGAQAEEGSQCAPGERTDKVSESYGAGGNAVGPTP